MLAYMASNMVMPRRPELEEWVTLSLGEVVLGRVVKADPVAPEKSDGWSPAWAEQRAKQTRSPVRLERATKDDCRLLRWELDGFNRHAAAVIRNGRLPSRPKVYCPAGRAIRCLNEPAAVELEHADRKRARLARPAASNRQENVWGTGRQPRHDKPLCQWVDQAEEPRGDALTEVR
jgi:hypothetical protein